ncbi:hypothetical protein I4U23_020254 [Adineta vaga]|nr:hypothetical protein I4U23_020254 [Adineta vaga]
MHLLIGIIGFSLFFVTLNGLNETCLHIQSKGKHCTMEKESILERMFIPPTTTENQECERSCIQSGYNGGGYCSISENCFRFCSCYHLVVSSSFKNE